ncbi:hypothetical protein ACJMK2_015659 [Sinanodonta woodiana]|uniref:Cysteine and tyrosine-rich protein 1 n=1 Tax=Sinanodonta woodiana TaxID=1069815 RepID=A0ABD3UR38_SINWO
MVQIEAYVLTFLTVLVGHVKAQYCNEEYRAHELYCPYGCCGLAGAQYCCDYSVTYTTFSGGAIAGIVLGSLFVIGLLIGAIVLCCCLRRRRATNGQILYSQANPGLTMTTGTTTLNGTPMPTTQMAPGMYAPPYAPPMAGDYTPNNAAIKNTNGSPPPV